MLNRAIVPLPVISYSTSSVVVAFSEKDYKAASVEGNSPLAIAIEKYVERCSIFEKYGQLYAPQCVGALQADLHNTAIGMSDITIKI